MAQSGAIRAGRAYVEISTEESRLHAGLKQIEAKLKGWQKSLATMAPTGAAGMSGALAGLGPIGILASVGVAAISVGIAAAAKAAIAFSEYGDEMSKAAEKAGMADDAFMGLNYAAKMSDISTESLSTALKFMQKNTAEAALSAEKADGIFRMTGVNLAAMRTMAPEDQFVALADAISKIENPAQKTAAAMELFGKSGAEMIPLLNQGGDGIRQMREEAEKMGLILSPQDVENAKALDDAWKRMKTSISGLINTIGAAAAPVITEIADLLREWVTSINGFIGKVKEVGGTFKVAGLMLKYEFVSAYFAIEEGWTRVVTAISNAWSDAIAAMKIAWRDFDQWVSSFGSYDIAGAGKLRRMQDAARARGIDVSGGDGVITERTKALEEMQKKHQAILDQMREQIGFSAAQVAIDDQKNRERKKRSVADFVTPAEMKTSAAGTFGAAALWGLGMGGPVQAIADNTGATVRGLDELNKKMDKGIGNRITFR